MFKCYQNNKLFDVFHVHSPFPLGDYERLRRENKSVSLKEKRKEIVRQLELLKGDDETEMIREYKNDLREADPFIYEAYEVIGREMIESFGYSVKRINEAMILKRFLIPVFADFRYNILNRNITPVFGTKIGYSVYDGQGVFFNPSIGCRFGLSESFALNLTFNYGLQTEEAEYYWSGYYESETVLLHTIGFKLGIEF